MKFTRKEVQDLAWMAWANSKVSRTWDRVGFALMGIGIGIWIFGILLPLLVIHDGLQSAIYALGNVTVTGNVFPFKLYAGEQVIEPTNSATMVTAITPFVVIFLFGLLCFVVGWIIPMFEFGLLKYRKAYIKAWYKNDSSLPLELSIENMLKERKLPAQYAHDED